MDITTEQIGLALSRKDTEIADLKEKLAIADSRCLHCSMPPKPKNPDPNLFVDAERHNRMFLELKETERQLIGWKRELEFEQCRRDQDQKTIVELEGMLDSERKMVKALSESLTKIIELPERKLNKKRVNDDEVTRLRRVIRDLEEKNGSLIGVIGLLKDPPSLDLVKEISEFIRGWDPIIGGSPDKLADAVEQRFGKGLANHEQDVSNA